MIYLFDLDGTLCYTPCKKGVHLYACALPYQNRIAQVNALYDEGHTIVIDTARGRGTGKDWVTLTMMQLARWGLRYHYLRVGEKLSYDVLVDDKAVRPEEFFNDSQ